MNLDSINKHATDALAGGSSAVTLLAYWTGVLSQFAQQLAPILTCLVLAATFSWYMVRFYDRWKHGPRKPDE